MPLRTLPAAALTAASFAALASPTRAQQPEPSAPHTHTLFCNHDEHTFTLVPPALGANILDGWLEPWAHTHYSRRGTPLVHLFANEPAFVGTDLLLDSSFTTGNDGAEIEFEAELEYALTRRIGVIVAAPYTFVNPDDGPSESGVGDIAAGPRFVLLEYDRFILSANIEFTAPTGDSDRGLGGGEAAINPSLSAWLDLGGDFTLHANAGVEHGLRTDADALLWGGAITYSIYTRGKPEIVRADGALRSHYPPGLLHLIAEIRGEHPLDGDEEGSGTAEWLLGASYSILPAPGAARRRRAPSLEPAHPRQRRHRRRDPALLIAGKR